MTNTSRWLQTKYRWLVIRNDLVQKHVFPEMCKLLQKSRKISRERDSCCALSLLVHTAKPRPHHSCHKLQITNSHTMSFCSSWLSRFHLSRLQTCDVYSLCPERAPVLHTLFECSAQVNIKKERSLLELSGEDFYFTFYKRRCDDVVMIHVSGPWNISLASNSVTFTFRN